MDKKDIVVVVPIYLPALSEMEAVSLKQCLDILSDYSIVIIKPENLDISNIQSQFLLPKVISFPDRCFQGIEAYNRLMTPAHDVPPDTPPAAHSRPDRTLAPRR